MPIIHECIKQETLHAVVENMTVAYCPSALVFHATVNATFRNVIITNNYSLGLLVSTCQQFTLTKSMFENC